MNALIVTADDVGLHRGMTLGAIRAHRGGIVTACSVAGAGPELLHAADLLRSCPGLDVGVHLMLTGGRPAGHPARVPTLLTSGGAFASDQWRFIARLARGAVSLIDVETEFRAQIERVLAAGLAPCHLNGHQHLHVLPGVFDVVVRLALEYRVPYVRIPADRAREGSNWVRAGAIFALGRLAARAAEKARAAGLCVNDCTIGVTDAGHLTAARVGRLLGRAHGLIELVTHPGTDGALIARTYSWGYDWDAETDALCDPALARRLTNGDIRLCGVRALAAANLRTAREEGSAPVNDQRS